MMLATTPRATTPAATAATAAGIALLFVGVLAATPASGPDAAIFPTVMITDADANEGLREPPLDVHAGITRLDGMEGGEGTWRLRALARERGERQGMGLA